MTGLLEGVALRGAGLLTQAAAVPVQPRPRSRFEPEGFAVEQREIPAAPPAGDSAVTTTPEHAAAPTVRPPSAEGEADAARRIAQPHADAQDGRRPPRLSPVAAVPLAGARRPSESTPRAQRRETKDADLREPSDLAAEPAPAVGDGEARPPRAGASRLDAGTEGPERSRRQPNPETRAAEPAPIEAPRRTLDEPPVPSVGVRIAAGNDGREWLAEAAPRGAGAEPAQRSGKKPASIEPARPLVSVSIGRIEVEIEPRPSPQPVPSRPPVPRTRGFEGYGRARHGQPR
jgi:hypothetical protein